MTYCFGLSGSATQPSESSAVICTAVGTRQSVPRILPTSLGLLRPAIAVPTSLVLKVPHGEGRTFFGSQPRSSVLAGNHIGLPLALIELTLPRSMTAPAGIKRGRFACSSLVLPR